MEWHIFTCREVGCASDWDRKAIESIQYNNITFTFFIENIKERRNGTFVLEAKLAALPLEIEKRLNLFDASFNLIITYFNCFMEIIKTRRKYTILFVIYTY